MSSWVYKKIDEVKALKPNAISMGPFGSRIKTENFVEYGVPVIRGTNLKEGRFSEKHFVYVTEEKAEELKSSMVFPEDIIFTHRGTLGQVGIIPYSDEFSKYIVSQSQMKLTCNKEIVSPLFVYYFFKSQIGQHELLKHSSSTGVPSISSPSTTLKQIEIPVPPMEIQLRIAEILSSLDDKIEHNQRINQTLDDMAMTLYRNWFVDFGPFSEGELYNSELGMIPKGWSIVQLKDIALINMGQSPKSEFYNLNNEGLPFHQGVTNFEYRYPSHKTYSSKILKVAEEGDILLSVRAPVGRLNIADTKIVIGRGIASLRHNENKMSFLYYCLRHIFRVEDQYGSGTVFNSINKTEIERMKVVLPPIEHVEKFENIVLEYDKLINSNIFETRTLLNIRDYLLPRLLSGDIEIKEGEKLVEGVL